MNKERKDISSQSLEPWAQRVEALGPGMEPQTEAPNPLMEFSQLDFKILRG